MNTEPPIYTVNLGEGADVAMNAGQIQAALRAGTIKTNTLVWREGMEGWRPVAELTGELGIEVQKPLPPRGKSRAVEVLPDLRVNALALAAKMGREEALARVAYNVEMDRAKQAAKIEKRTGRWMAFMIASLLIVAGLAYFSPKQEETPGYGGSKEKREVQDFAESVLLEALKAPATAKITTLGVNINTDSKGALVHGYVDAQNGFGALIRSNWTILLEREGSLWSVKDLDIKGR